MIRYVVLGIGVLILGMGRASSDPIEIIAGEHQTFTRIVLQIPENTQWNIIRETGKARVEFDEFVEGFDASRTFAVIPKTRLSSVSTTDSSVEFLLACDCPVDAFLERGEFLVIDINDGLPLPTAASDSEAESTPVLPQSAFGYGDLLWSRVPRDEITSQEGESSVPQRPEAEARLPEETHAEPESLEATQKALLHAFAEASSRQIIDADLPELSPENPDDASTHIASEAAPGFYDTLPAIDPTKKNSTQIYISDSFQSPNQKPKNSTGYSCPDPAFLDISEWADFSSFIVQDRSSDLKVYDEAGNLDAPKLLARIKFLLHFGFGAEALQVAKLSRGLEQEHPYLIDIANIMEFGYIRNPRILHHYLHCDSDLAFWAILSDQKIEARDMVNGKAALQALEDLPQHLRLFLGEALSKKFAQSGMIDEAGIALRSSQRAMQELGRQNSLSEALIAQASGEPERSQELLNALLVGSDPEAPAALIALINGKISRNELIEADLALAVESFAFEFENSELGEPFAKARVLAAAGSGQYAKAFEALISARARVTRQSVSQLENTILTLITERGGDMEFLEATLNRFDFSEGNWEPHKVLKAANRLLSIGFLTEAEEMALATPEGFHPTRKKLLLAEIMIKKSDGERALGYLKDLTSDTAKRLRAEALLLNGLNEQAHSAYLALNADDEAAFAAWTAENWASLVAPEHPVFGPSVSLSGTKSPNLSADDNLLAESAAAIRSSTEARSAIAELLKNTDSVE